MALLYPWATKEYILWQMSLGQVILYLNVGMDIKYPEIKKEGQKDKLKAREEMVALGLLEPEPSKEELEKKYGDIDDKKGG